MYERLKKTSSYRIVAFFAGFLFLSASLSVAIQSPTNALSLNLGETVQSVTNNVPIVKNVVPLLLPSQTTPAAPTQTQQTAPATTNTQTPAQQPAQTQTAPAAQENVQTEAAQGSAAVSSGAARTVSSTAATPVTQNGLSVGAKETQIASAIPHASSPAITYGTNALNGKTAGAIILGSLAAIAGGAYVLYAYRPSVFARK